MQEPLFAEAQSGLAHACVSRSTARGGDLTVGRRRSLLSMGKVAAQAALATDGTLAEAHAALGMILLFYDWDWLDAERAFGRALEADSNSALAHYVRAVLAVTTLDRTRAVREIQRAIELDPLNQHVRAESRELSYWMRDYSQAVEYATQALDLEPLFLRAHFVLGRVHEAQGRIPEAISEYERAGVIAGSAAAARRAVWKSWRCPLADPSASGSFFGPEVMRGSRTLTRQSTAWRKPTNSASACWFYSKQTSGTTHCGRTPASSILCGASAFREGRSSRRGADFYPAALRGKRDHSRPQSRLPAGLRRQRLAPSDR